MLTAPGPRGKTWRQSRHRLRRQTLTELVALRGQYGDLIRLPILPHPVMLVSHPDGVEHILRKHADNYRKGAFFKSITRLQGEGLLTSEGERWRQQRRLLQPVFRASHLANFGALMVEEVQALIDAWRRLAQLGKALDVVAWMHRLSFRVMARALLGMTPAALDPVGQQLQEIGARLLPYLGTSLALVGSWGLPAWMPTCQTMRFRRAVAAYHDCVQQLVVCRRRAGIDASTTDLLARLITAHDDQSCPYLTAQQLRDEVITFIGAGVETSAQALSWTCYLLACHPKMARQVKDEVDTVVGARPPMPHDLPRLVYGRMVLDEVMRLYPPAAILPRQANVDDEIGGYAVPRHAVVLMSQYVTHRHPDFWSDPEHFCPERFRPGRTAGQHRFAYFPFGEGPRSCIGKPFALMEMQLALATIAQTYRLELVQNRPVLPLLATTLQPRDGLWMTVKPYI